MLTPRNDADALHTLLTELTEPDQIRVHSRWAEVLECEWETPEFARRHSEVVVLYNSTMRDIAMLPTKAAQRFTKYAWKWWYAVIASSHAWPNNVDSKSVIDQASLDQLGSAADLLDSHMGGSAVSPRSHSLTDLASECAAWIEELEGFADLPDALRLSLLHDLKHVLWLIENAHLFGAGRVVAQTQRILGEMALATVHVRDEKKPFWSDRVAKLCGIVLQLTGLFAATDAALEAGQGLADTIVQLTTGEHSEQTEVVEAEIVDDDEN